MTILSNANITTNAALSINNTGLLTIDGGSKLASISSSFSISSTANTINLGSNSTAASLSGLSVSISSSGSITSSALQVSAVNAVSVSAGGALNDEGGSGITSSKGADSITALNVVIGSGSSVAAATGVTITGKGGNLNLSSGSKLSTNSGVLQLSASASADINATLTAGVLKGNPGITNLPSTQFSSVGSIKIAAASISLGDSSNTLVTSNGGNITMTAGAGSIVLGASGNSNTIQANGGNVIILASKQISGSSGNQFIAMSTGTTAAASSGGGIELGAGTLVSTLASAAAQKSGSVSEPFATNSVVNNPGVNSNTSGVVATNFSSGASGTNSINVSSSGANQAVLNLNGGVIDFDSKGAANTLQLDGATFSVAALKPISFSSTINAANEIELGDVAVDSNSVHRGINKLANIFVAGRSGAQMLSSRATSDRSAWAGLSITIEKGEFFICPLVRSVIHSEFGNLQVKKGALVLVTRDESTLRAINCSESADVEIVTGDNSKITLAAGEEIVLSDHKLSDEHVQKLDGIGRRAGRQFRLSSNVYASVCDASIISILTSTPYLSKLRHPACSAERQIAARMLKTASAVQTVTAYRGLYRGCKSDLDKAI